MFSSYTYWRKKRLVCEIQKKFFLFISFTPLKTFTYFLILLVPTMCLTNLKRIVQRKIRVDFACWNLVSSWYHGIVESSFTTFVCMSVCAYEPPTSFQLPMEEVVSHLFSLNQNGNIQIAIIFIYIHQYL